MGTKADTSGKSGDPAGDGPSLADITRLLERTNERLTDLARALRTAPGQGLADGLMVADAQILTWEDDPFSETIPGTTPVAGKPSAVDAPTFANPLLATAIAGTRPAVTCHPVGTPAFRFLLAEEALSRGIAFWSALLPAGTKWSTSNPMQVQLEAGTDLNANYSRKLGLRFFGKRVGGLDVFSSESPDVVCHELGHAVLDALKPQLFDAASTEVSAFHEAFGDMSAILCGLQLRSVRAKVLNETRGRLNVNSRLSRVAEQLGWAIRQTSPDRVDRDALRNAANSFFYRRPDLLPAQSPASQLSTRPHNFSRVFSGAFLDGLAGMFALNTAADEGVLLEVSRDVGQLLVDSVHTAPIRPEYFSQVAAAMIQADKVRFAGRYGRVLSRAFVKRGILAVDSAMGLADVSAPVLVASPAGATSSKLGMADLVSYDAAVDDGYLREASETPQLPVSPIAMGELRMHAHVADEATMFDVAPAIVGIVDGTLSPLADTGRFVENLIQRGELDLTPPAGAARSEAAAMVEPDVIPVRPGKMTHVLASEAGQLVLKRNHFNCGMCGDW